jgi:hypothetical protein
MAYSSALSQFTFNSTVIKAVGSIAFSMQRTPLDVTSIGSWNTYFIDGISSSAFTLDVFYSYLDHSALITDILNPLNTGRPRSFTIKLGSYTSGGAVNDTITGTCIITSWDAVSASADVVKGSFSCQIVGPVTVVADVADIGNAETAPA